ncbi:MAG TPA: hypothetical protein VGG45_09455 [Terracidiphilus sp.]|jgi:hypothetical protein
MALCDDCFAEFLHPLVHESIEKNERFDAEYGGRDRWDWDSDLNILTFSGHGQPIVRIHCSIVGTTQGNRWQWSWGNRNLPDVAKRELEKVLEFGEANGFEKLTSAFLEADEYTGWEMTAIAVHILDAPGSYRFPTEHGFCYLAYREVEILVQETSSELEQ